MFEMHHFEVLFQISIETLYIQNEFQSFTLFSISLRFVHSSAGRVCSCFQFFPYLQIWFLSARRAHFGLSLKVCPRSIAKKCQISAQKLALTHHPCYVFTAGGSCQRSQVTERDIPLQTNDVSQAEHIFLAGCGEIRFWEANSSEEIDVPVGGSCCVVQFEKYSKHCQPIGMLYRCLDVSVNWIETDDVEFSVISAAVNRMLCRPMGMKALEDVRIRQWPSVECNFHRGSESQLNIGTMPGVRNRNRISCNFRIEDCQWNGSAISI